MKALWGSDAPVYTDHVEHIRLEADMNDKSDTAKVGQDFATSMGPGGVIGTKFTWPTGPENMQLTGEREKHWRKWVKLYNEKMLSKGTYLNLYDIIYDKPESHVIQKDDNFYYAFYAGKWQGSIELRGLKEKTYRVYDYVNERDLGTVSGPLGIITDFENHLLIECMPVEQVIFENEKNDLVIVQIPTSIADFSDHGGLAIYPNPSKGKVTIAMKSVIQEPVEISVHTITGQEIYRKRFDMLETSTVDLSSQNDGFYFLKIKAGSKEITRKLILRKQFKGAKIKRAVLKVQLFFVENTGIEPVTF